MSDKVVASPLLSYAHGTNSNPLLGQTIGANLRTTVDQHADREALVVCSQGYRATYRQFWETTTKAALGFMGLGVEPGDRVGIWSSNRFEWAIVQYAAARVGAILVNINPAYQATELEYVFRQSGISVLLHSQGLRQSLYGPIVEAVRPNCPDLRHIFRLDEDWDLLLRQGKAVSQARLDQREALLQFDDPINLQYTSGTTGLPKGATLTHHNILNNAYFVGLALGYSEHDRVCIPVPLYHTFGCVLGTLACISHGACMVIPGDSFQARNTIEAVHTERCTSLYGVPTMFRAILEEPDFERFDCSSLRTGIMAGAPCPVELMKEVVGRLHMPEVAIGYGMTETSPISTITSRDDALDCRVSTVGRVLPHVEVCIQDPSNRALLPRGSAGEFCTRGYSVMSGYWNDDKATHASIDHMGWMHSGDLATMDEAGYVHIVGRLKDIIIRGGENISPREIEEVLVGHPDVSEAQVIGIPSHKYGEEVMAWVRLRPGTSSSEEELATHCKNRLAGFKVPRYWQFVQMFPLTATGKVQKFRLREMAVELLGRQSAANEKMA